MSNMSFEQSRILFKKGEKVFPLGVNSPGRGFAEVDTPALMIKSAQGARITDADGNEYMDFIMGLGPCLLGHNHPSVISAIKKHVDSGLVFGINSVLEPVLAEKIINAIPIIEKIRFTCSGTEAVMSALRVARAHTKKSALLKFRGGYHGHSDIALAQASKKVIRESNNTVRDGLHSFIDEQTFVVDYNDVDAVNNVFAEVGNELAAVILEPIASNMGLVRPKPEFLHTIRKLCDSYGALLIFDEVVTGFRFCNGSVSDQLGVIPDMITLGKVIGGGLAIGAYGAKTDIMSQVGEIGSVFQGGTFAGNPLTMAAGIATMDVISEDGFYGKINKLAQHYVNITIKGFSEKKIPFSIDNYGALASYIFIEDLDRLSCFADVEKQNTNLFNLFHTEMLSRGYLFPPTIEEPIFFSAAHTLDDIERAASEAVDVISKIV